MAFDPDKYIKKNKGPSTSAFNPDAYLRKNKPQEPPEDMTIADKILEPIIYGGEALDRFSGAPIRAGIGALQDDDPETGFWETAYDQFGEPTRLAPTGKEIAQNAGVSDDVIYEDAPIVGDITKSGLAGFGVDVLADAGVIASAGSKLLGAGARAIPAVEGAIKSRAGKSAMKAVSQASTDLKVAKVLQKSRADKIGTTLLDEGLGKYLNKPVKLIEEIKGKGKLISKYSDDTTNLIKKVSAQLPEPFDVKKMFDDITIEDLQSRLDPELATKLDAGDADRYEKILKKYLKIDTSRYRGIEKLQALKKDIGKKLNSDTFFNPQDKSIALEKEVLRDIYRKLNSEISNAVEGIKVNTDNGLVDAGSIISGNNEKISAMMDTLEMLDKIPAKELRGMSGSQELVDLMVSGLTGVAVGGATGSTGLGLAAAGAYGGSKLGKNIADKIPALEARLLDSTLKGDVLPNKTIMGAQVPRVMSTQRSNSREPQSLPMELVKMKVPRTSQGILENRELIEMKIAQERPEMLENIQYVFDNEPESLPDVLPVISKFFPQIFERDEYGRIDGKIIDPQMKIKAEKDTMNDDGLTNSERMLIIDNLNKTGEFPL